MINVKTLVPHSNIQWKMQSCKDSIFISMAWAGAIITFMTLGWFTLMAGMDYLKSFISHDIGLMQVIIVGIALILSIIVFIFGIPQRQIVLTVLTVHEITNTQKIIVNDQNGHSIVFNLSSLNIRFEPMLIGAHIEVSGKLKNPTYTLVMPPPII